MVSRNSQRNGAVRAWCRRAVEAEPLVSDLFTYRTEPGELADARYQDGRFASKGLRLVDRHRRHQRDRKSTRLNSSHPSISYAVFCLKKKKQPHPAQRNVR